MVPAIFQKMEKAEDSDGFDSCEEEFDAQVSDPLSIQGNPFKDFEVEI